MAHRNALRLLRLVNTLLDFSRIEAGRIDTNFEPTDLASFTAGSPASFARRSSGPRARRRLRFPVGAGVDRPGDVGKRSSSMLSNAFWLRSEGRITVRLQPLDGRVELRVSDTGVGIPSADLPRMFERFHRVKHTRARTHEGTKVGLALVRTGQDSWRRGHGRQRRRRGTTFTVTVATGTAHLPPERIAASRQLPSTSVGAIPDVEEALRWLPTRDEPGQRGGSDPEIDVESTKGAARILVADDNADMREYLRPLARTALSCRGCGRWKRRARPHPAGRPGSRPGRRDAPSLDGFGLLAAVRGGQVAVRSRSFYCLLVR